MSRIVLVTHCCISVLAWTVDSASLRALRSGKINPVLDTPDLTAYDPVKVLCTHGTELQSWCQTWVGCVKEKAAPAGDAEAVMNAWKPADCREVCGVWPNMTAPEGSNMTAPNMTAFLEGNGGKRDCMESCGNFQGSLSTCVATILFEPGKVAAMMPDDQTSDVPDHCTKEDTPCMPDLSVRHQRCLSHKTKAVLNKDHQVPDATKVQCEMLKNDLELCKDCPQLQDNYVSEYAAFTGGCMDQLNAYWQATHPGAGSSAIPGAAGCTVH